jgi:hypothetical protein
VASLLAPIALALAFGAAEPSAAGEPVVAFSPPRVVLGETRSVRLRVRLPGAGERAGPPRLSSTFGTLTVPRRESKEEWSASLDLPGGGPPRLAIVSAARDDLRGAPSVGFVAIPLRGQAVVPVQTEPGAKVVVAYGEERAGPFTAGPDGRLRVTLPIPPGVSSARVRAHGQGGRTERSVDLAVPNGNRLALVATPAGAGRVRIDLFVAPGERPLAIVSLGDDISDPVPVPGQPGRYTMTVAGEPGLLAVQAALKGDPSSTASLEVRLAGEETFVTAVDGR